jgi:hypothetical protein
MYAQGEYLFAILALILSASASIFMAIAVPIRGATFIRSRWDVAVCPVSADVYHRDCLY